MEHVVYLLLAIGLTSLLTPFTGFPFVGLAMLGIVIASVLLYGFEKKTRRAWLFWGFCVLFSSLLVIRINPALVFFNFVAAVYFGSLLTVHRFNLTDYIFSSLLVPFHAVLGILFTPVRFSGKLAQIQKWVLPTALSVLALMVIVPLLASANPFFADYTQVVLEPIFDFLEVLDVRAFKNAFRLILGGLLFGLLAKSDVFAKRPRIIENKLLAPVDWSQILGSLLMPKIVVSVVLGLFFITQLQLYFASPEALWALGYNHSRVTREVFGQLSLVTLVVFAILYNDRRTSKWNMILAYILLGEAIFLNLMALKSVWEYASTWGLTYKRLWGFVTVIWLTGMVGLFWEFLREKISQGRFLLVSGIFTGCLLLVVNVVNFDYMIGHYDTARTQAGTDYSYVSRLSVDAAVSEKQIRMLTESLQAERLSGAPKAKLDELYALSSHVREVKRLRRMYADFDIRTFHLSEYLEYLRTKDIDLETAEAEITYVYQLQAEEYRQQVNGR